MLGCVRTLGPGLAWCALVAVAHAEAPGPFEAIPGVREHSGRLVVKLKTEGELALERADAEEARVLREASEAFLDQAASPLPTEDVWTIVAPDGDAAALATDLLATGAYEYVEPDWRVFPVAEPDDPGLTSQWHHDVMASRDAWDTTTGLPVIICAACDSGVDLDHPDLAGALVPGVNTAAGGQPIPQADGGDVADLTGHGTFVAGCMAAIGDNGVDVCGVGWSFSLMPVRVTERFDGTALLSDIVEGAIWAAEHGARAINCSYTGVDSSLVQSAGEAIKGHGGLLFWAAGNDGRDLAHFDHPDVIIVGATAINDTRPAWSAHGRAVDLFAPGASVRSTKNGGGYGADSGTSYAAPIAAGVAALVWSVDPAMSPDEVEQALLAGCDDLGPDGEDDEWGHGRVNAAASVALVSPPVGPPSSFDLLSPVAGASGVGSMPLFEWTGSANAGWYELTVDDDPAFGSPEIDLVVFGTSYQPAFLTLAFEEQYWVRVEAHNPLGWTPSSAGVISVTTGASPLPGAFALSSPAEGASDVAVIAGFSWTPSADAASYTLTLDDDADLSSPLHQVTVPWDQPWTGLPAPLEHSTTYYWSVEASNVAGAVTSSPAVAAFTTRPLPPPGGFSLLSPASGAVGVPTGPALEWNQSTNADWYEVWVATDAAFTDLVHQAEIVVASDGGLQPWKVSHLVPPGTLAPETGHFWLVVAHNDGGRTFGTPLSSGFTTAPGDVCVGDVDGDGDTDFADFSTMAANFGRVNAEREDGDLSGDGTVDSFDFALLASDFGCSG